MCARTPGATAATISCLKPHSPAGAAAAATSTRLPHPRQIEKTTLATQAAIGLLDHSSTSLFHHDQAPGDWRAYCGYHHLYLTAPDWEALTPAGRTAITHWVRLGGNLHLVRTAPGKSLAELGLPRPDSGQPTGAVGRGSVDDPNGDKDLKKKPDTASDDWALRATNGKAVREWERRDAAAFALPSAKLAAGFMLVVVVVFAILVGPVNVFVLAPARRRHRLFVTTPLISLAAGGLLVISVIVSDGIGGKGLRYVWLESGPAGDNTSYLVQHQHSRCGAMLSTGFVIPEDAYFAPMMVEHRELAGNLSVEVQPGKVLAGGPWFSSRRSQHFYLAAARPGRGRIEQTGSAAQPVLTSTFAFPLGRIFWLAPDGTTWWQAAALAQGSATALQPCTEAEVQQALADATRHAPPEYGKDLATASRRPGHFLALADQLTAIETHRSIRWQTHGFVTGPVVTP